MQATMLTTKQLRVPPSQATEEADDEPPDSGPCPDSARSVFNPLSAGRLVRIPAQRAKLLNPAVRNFRKRHFPDISTKQWNDWQWQVSHRIRTLMQLESMVTLSEAERLAFSTSSTLLPF